MNDEQKVYLVYVIVYHKTADKTGNVETWVDSIWTTYDAAVDEADRIFSANENVTGTGVIEHVTDRSSTGENKFDYNLEKTLYTRT